jgi:Tfp pilus assembly protein PilF
MGQFAEALAVLQTRLAERDARSAQVQLVRLYLGTGDVAQTLALSEQLTVTAPVTGTHWSLLGQVHLQRGDLDAAEAAFRRHQLLAPNSRLAMSGLMHVYQRRGDVVSAAAYAVRAYTVNPGEDALPIYLVRELYTFFAETGDANRQRAAEEQLAQRQADEVAQLRGKSSRHWVKGERRVIAAFKKMPPLPRLFPPPNSECLCCPTSVRSQSAPLNALS